MTEQTPPPPPPPGPEPTAQLTPADPGAGPTSGRRGRKGLVIGGIAGVVALALAGGAFAVYHKLDGGGAQPHDVLPSSVIAYARVDVDPSASQKVSLLRLVRKFPRAADEIGIKSADQDVRKLLVEEALTEGDCDLSYDDDVKPWLGDRIGFGLDREATPLVAIQVTDEGKAEKGIEQLFGCADEKAAIAFLDGYAIVAEDQKTADAAVDAATEKPLAERKEFADDFDALGEPGVASAWGDASALLDEVPELGEGFGVTAPPQLDELKEAGTFAMALRTDGSTLELAGLSGLTDSVEEMTAAPIGTLPADTVAALSIGGFGDQVAEQLDALMDDFASGFAGGFGPSTDPSFTDDMTPEQKDAYEQYLEDNPVDTPDPQDYIRDFERSTGLKVPEDVETLLGESLTVAVGADNLERIPTLSGPADVSALDIALQMRTDPAKAFDLAKRLAALASQAGITLSTSQTDDGAVLATNQDAADSLGQPGKLGEDETFTSVMPFGDETVYGLFLDVGTVLDKLREANPPDDVADDLDEVDPLRAVGISTGKDGDHARFSLKVAFSK